MPKFRRREQWGWRYGDICWMNESTHSRLALLAEQTGWGEEAVINWIFPSCFIWSTSSGPACTHLSTFSLLLSGKSHPAASVVLLLLSQTPLWISDSRQSGNMSNAEGMTHTKLSLWVMKGGAQSMKSVAISRIFWPSLSAPVAICVWEAKVTWPGKGGTK